MSEISLESGACIGFGGTNARVGVYQHGDILGFHADPTPIHPTEFFAWMAQQTLSLADKGANWIVAGFPGPVTADGVHVGPMANVPGLANSQYSLAKELTVSDPAVGRLLKDGFHLLAVNDGELAAQAAAHRVGKAEYSKVAALILGTGVGAGIVHRDDQQTAVFRADGTIPAEIGHLPRSANPYDTFERAVSGRALENRYGVDPKELDANHPAWHEVGAVAGQLTMTLALMNGAELVVPCGGVGAAASDKYGPHLRTVLEGFASHGNGTQRHFLPVVKPVSAGDAQIFELYGAEGVMRDFMTRPEPV